MEGPPTDCEGLCAGVQWEAAEVTPASGNAPTMLVGAGFANICAMLDWSTPATPYPRGFPYYARHKSENWEIKKAAADVHVNAGLWLTDPDCDAITWLVSSPKVKKFGGRSLVLGEKSWAPVNTQNTGLRRDMTPLHYFIRMGYPISGTTIDRYGDIFSRYFAQACVKQLGGVVRFSTPLVDRKRNSHNYIKDAGREWACIVLLEDILPWLCSVKLEGKNYIDAYLSLSPCSKMPSSGSTAHSGPIQLADIFINLHSTC